MFRVTARTDERRRRRRRRRRTNVGRVLALNNAPASTPSFPIVVSLMFRIPMNFPMPYFLCTTYSPVMSANGLMLLLALSPSGGSLKQAFIPRSEHDLTSTFRVDLMQIQEEEEETEMNVCRVLVLGGL